LLVAIALNALEDVADGGGFNGTEGTMNIGYARTSTVEQEASFEAQQAQLKAAGCEKVFCEQVSAVSPEREQLEAALDYVRDGDVLIVTKLDRLARSVPNLCEIGQRLDGKGVGLKVLDQAIDTTTPTGRLMFNMLGAIAQFERELIRERMLVGIAKAKAEGKYRGRAPTARMQAEKVRQLKAAGVGPSEIARQLGIGRTSVFRILTAA
jgi:DNA invertase Pin-like site-specific DNA recombinase